MELIEGPSLAVVIADAEREANEAPDRVVQRMLRTMARLAEALASVHDRGVVHGDITPSNVIVSTDDTPVLIDFGCAFRDGLLAGLRELARDGLPSYGTSGYVAPEVSAEFPGDSRSDIFSLGRVFQEMLRAGSQSVSTLFPVPVRELVESMLASDPGSRPQDAHAVAFRVSAPTRRTRYGRLHVCSVGLRVRARLIGRESELARIERSLSDASCGRATFVRLGGEAGIGKTCFLNEIIGRARRYGFGVLSTHCDSQLAGARSESAIINALKGSLRTGRHAALERLPAWSPSSCDVNTAEHCTRAPGSRHAARARTLDATAELLAELTECQPQLLAIDDLQWADELTLAFVRSERLRDLSTSKLLVVVTTRSDENVAPIAALRGADWDELELKRLSPDQTRLVLNDLLGRYPRQLELWIHAQTEGNPLYVKEFVHALISSGALVQRSQSAPWELTIDRTAPGAEHAIVPATRSTLIDRRLASLTHRARRVAAVASLLDFEFHEAELLEAVVAAWQMPRDELGMALQDLVGAHVISSSGDAYRFAHDLHRQAASRLISELGGRELNARLAEYYESKPVEPLSPDLAPRLGRLWAAAGNPAGAFHHFSRAADAAVRRNESALARELYARAVHQGALMYHAGDVGIAARLTLCRMRLADILHAEARCEEADEQYKLALETVGKDDLFRARLWWKRARALRTAYLYDRAEAALLEAEKCLGDAQGDLWWYEWLEVQLTRYWNQYYARRQVSDVLTRIADHLDRGTTAQRSTYLQAASSAELAANGYIGTIRSCNNALRALELISSDVDLADRLPDAQMVAAFALLWSGAEHNSKAVALLEAAERGAHWYDDTPLLAQVRTYLALAHRCAGRVDETERIASLAVLSAERCGSAGYVGAALASSAWVAWSRGHNRVALELIQRARASWRDGALRHPFQCYLNLVWMELLRMLEQFEQAHAVALELLAEDQHRLPEPLEHGIRSIAKTAGDARELDLALLQVTVAARHHRYL